MCALAFFVTVSSASPREAAAAHSGPSRPSENLPSAGEIMTKVAANQDQSQADRTHYVYVQNAQMVSRRGKTVVCDEITDYRVTPSAKNSRQQLLKLDGRLWSH